MKFFISNLKPTVLNISAFLLIIALPANLFAWGSDGHRIVARIAEKHLTEKTKKAIMDQNLLDELPDGFASCKTEKNLADKLACVATWADAVRKGDNGKGEKNGDMDFLQTNNWHFVDLSLENANYLEQRDCKDQLGKKGKPGKGVCGILALDALINFLTVKNPPSFRVASFKPLAKDFDRRNAIRFIVHIIGDLHQPLHTVEEGGGENAFEVTYLDHDCAKKVGSKCVKTLVTNLHHVWDTEIISTFAEQKKLDEIKYAEMIDKDVKMANEPAFNKTMPIRWLTESHKIAIADFDRFQKLEEFETSDGESVPKVDSAYVAVNTPIINLQLKRAGVRLAQILNQIFGK